MRLGMVGGLVLAWTAALAAGQTTYRGAKSVGAVMYRAQGPGQAGTGENFYCPAGTGELTEGAPTWGTFDGQALLPTRCMNTALSSTPGGTHIGGGTATTFTPSDATALTAALASVQCGDTIMLTAGNAYTGSFTMPAPACDGGHWITVKSSGVSNGSFPAEGVRATPCVAGITNDATNGRSNPGYPDYPCPSYPAVLSAQIASSSNNQPALSFTTGANHYRFIGIEVTKVAETKMDAGLVSLAADGTTLGANHIVFDRSIIHGQPWNLSTSSNAETQDGVSAKNSQWIAVVNSWIYDTYCNSACVDSHTFGGGTGAYQDGPFKLYNNLLATSGETWLFGGGGQGGGTPNTKDFEARANHAMKPLVWMVPIESCKTYNAVTTKNLGEYKNMTYALVEGNYLENSWQGCQSDQIGYALALNPSNQNNHQSMAVTFDGSSVVQSADGQSFTHDNGSPADAANCPPGGCVLEISDPTRPDNNADYIFCDGNNGCDQSGMNLTDHARLTTAVTAGTAVNVNACVPGDCPSCKAENVTWRYNEIYNTTNGFQVNSGLSSHCHDEAAGMNRVTIRDTFLHGLSREMSNGSDPYQASSCAVISSNTQRSINTIEVSHNTCAIETGNNSGFGGLGNQIDHTDVRYLSGLNVHDNVSPAPWIVSHGNGSIVTKGIGNAAGLANTYATDSCHSYYPLEAPNGVVQAGALASFTFSPALSSYMVTLNGQYRAINSGYTNSSFTLTTAASAGDEISVRDLNDCPWTFRGNLLGTSLAGSGSAYDPYPNTNNTNCGVSGTASCILDGSAFTALFVNWGGGRSGTGTLASSAYSGSASDASARGASGQDPGADTATIATLTGGVHGTTYYPALTVTTTSLPGAAAGTAYQAALQASPGASPHKSWWIETDPSQCGGNCGTFPASAGILVGRSGVVNGPFIISNVSRTGNVSTFTLKQTIVAGTWLMNQSITMSGFANGTGTQANDGTFNGTCVISAVATNSFSCAQTGVDVGGHTPKDASVATFAPVGAGSFSFWVGARDGAFQTARGAVTLTVGP